MSEMTPSAPDCQIVCARTPVKTYSIRLIPDAAPKPACSVVPRMPMKISGKLKSAMMRVRSRRSLMRSRCASVRTPESSLILEPRADDLEIRVLKAGRMGADHRQRCLDRAKHRVHATAGEHHFVGAVAGDRQLQPGELVTQTRAIVRVDDHILLDQLRLDLVRRAERNDLALVDDADRVRLLRLFEVVRREEHRRPAFAADHREVFPQRAPARDVETGGRLVEEQDLWPMEQA